MGFSGVVVVVVMLVVVVVVVVVVEVVGLVACKCFPNETFDILHGHVSLSFSLREMQKAANCTFFSPARFFTLIEGVFMLMLGIFLHFCLFIFQRQKEVS